VDDLKMISRQKMAVRFLLLLVFALTAICRAQESALSNLPAQPIGKGDLLALNVYNAPEFSRSLRVSPKGSIEIPMVSEPVPAEGLTPGELAAELRSVLESHRLLVRPSVTVSVLEYRSRTVNVIGAVRKPTAFQQVAPLTLSYALTQAEGLSPEAGDEVLIVRAPDKSHREANRQTERVLMSRRMDGSIDAPEIQIYAGDEIRVPATEKIFVVGNVRKPGAFRADSADRGTILSMLALSEGLAPFAARTAYIYRKTISGREELPVPLGRILARKTPDVTLRAGDVLYVPDNKRRRLALTTVDRIVNFGAGTGSGMLIWRR
jgi:polysaccharide export outer membrane protein